MLGLTDLVIPCLIVNIIHESSKVRLTNNLQGEVRFRRADIDSESCSDEEEIVPDKELEEWLDDTQARRDSFERKMDAKTARDSLQWREAEWIVAGKITQQFLTEIEVHYEDTEEIVEDGNLVDYNSVMDWKNENSVNFDVD